jgi:hypothetical protein
MAQDSTLLSIFFYNLEFNSYNQNLNEIMYSEVSNKFSYILLGSWLTLSDDEFDW